MEGTFGSLKEKLKENNEFFFTGIGGQGVVTGSTLFLEGLAESTWHLTGVYSPGAERRGKPISCFIGLYNDPKKTKSYELLTMKDFVIIFDPASLGKEQLLNGLREDGTVLFNTPKSPEELVEKNEKLKYFNVATIDASGIFSEVFSEAFGRAPTFEEIRPNVPTIAALFNVTGLASLETFLRVIENKWRGRIGDINKQAAISAYDKAQVMQSSEKGMDITITKTLTTPVDELNEIALCFPTEGIGGPTGLWALIQPKIKEELCNNCGTCFIYCPDNCIIWTKGKEGVPKIDLKYCKGCGICAEECKQDAIEMVEVKR
jgi:2-oxoacid:acceptor oxidoreductase gamma subunit (pyruvate/2-ketoisovalerate family)/2-oxoacid:acceptor oxidoreductase delta subunit (pyruvate/2-ketoisovalerate family)